MIFIFFLDPLFGISRLTNLKRSLFILNLKTSRHVYFSLMVFHIDQILVLMLRESVTIHSLTILRIRSSLAVITLSCENRKFIKARIFYLVGEGLLDKVVGALHIYSGLTLYMRDPTRSKRSVCFILVRHDLFSDH